LIVAWAALDFTTEGTESTEKSKSEKPVASGGGEWRASKPPGCQVRVALIVAWAAVDFTTEGIEDSQRA